MITLNSGHILSGWQRDPIDERDHLFAGAPVALPPMVDLSPGCSPVEDQGQLGSCTGNAIVGALEYANLTFKNDSTDLSRLFVYYNERVAEGTVKEDAGAIIRDGIKSVSQYGACPEIYCKYDITKFTKKPTKTAYKKALKYRIASYQSITSLDGMLQCLAQSTPFVFGFTVYESFESQAVADTGIMPMPKPGEQVLGGHAVLAVGYDKRTNLMKCRNSWGANWGDKGYFYMPFNFIADTSQADDMWAIKI